MIDNPESTDASAWAVVRHVVSEGRYYVDIYSIGCTKEEAMLKAMAIDKRMPQWAAQNKIERAVRVTVKEDNPL